MRGSIKEYSTDERAAQPIQYDNIYRYSYEEAARRYMSVKTLFENEEEFNDYKKRKQIA